MQNEKSNPIQSEFLRKIDQILQPEIDKLKNNNKAGIMVIAFEDDYDSKTQSRIFGMEAKPESILNAIAHVVANNQDFRNLLEAALLFADNEHFESSTKHISEVLGELMEGMKIQRQIKEN